MTSGTNVAANLQAILARIAAARKSAVAPAPHTTLIAVSKGHGAERILPALEAGQRVFGENRVQEAQVKWPALKTPFPDLELHLIGPLQTNKVKDALALFDAIHSLDRPRLAEALSAEIAKGASQPELFIQVNIGEEPQKSGVAIGDTVAFHKECLRLGLTVSGLMCIPPVEQNPAPYFALLKKLAGECGLNQLSMGMSEDFETAVKFGATHVRVGTAIFGERAYVTTKESPG